MENQRDIELLEISDSYRKDDDARLEMIKAADISFLCLPDEEAKKIAEKISKKDKVIDTSTAHRTESKWVYGMPEIGNREEIKKSNHISVPGCHATGAILLLKPLIENKIISEDLLLSIFSTTGFSGGGKKMIAEYDENDYSAPRVYGLSQEHKHMPEILHFSGLNSKPVFVPEVANYFNGIRVTVPIHRELTINPSALKKNYIESINDIYQKAYGGEELIKIRKAKDGEYVSSNDFADKDDLEIIVSGNDNRAVLMACYDNLGKGASGAAIQCMNLMLGRDEKEGLVYGN
jgi:N-acetyl-gamma-glutamyl-phosphate reductase